MSLQRKENNLRKAQARFDKVSRRSKLFQIDFRREANSRGRFHTRAYIVRGEKMHHGGRGIIHKVANAKYRITGDKLGHTDNKIMAAQDHEGQAVQGKCPCCEFHSSRCYADGSRYGTRCGDCRYENIGDCPA